MFRERRYTQYGRHCVFDAKVVGRGKNQIEVRGDFCDSISSFETYFACVGDRTLSSKKVFSVIRRPEFCCNSILL